MRIELVISPEILDEYRRVGEELAKKYPGVDMGPILEFLTIKARIVDALPLNPIHTMDAAAGTRDYKGFDFNLGDWEDWGRQAI